MIFEAESEVCIQIGLGLNTILLFICDLEKLFDLFCETEIMMSSL